MTETEHLHLKKPGQGDYYNVDDFNGNADLIDTKLKEIDDSVAQPSGIATLDSSGKLAQMPTAADVGAVPSESTIRLRVTGDDAVPHYADANDYKIPGQRISISPQVTAASVDNLPETNSGQLCVYGFDSNSIYQIYETFWGTRWIRQYTISTGAWGTWMGGRPKSITIPGVAGAITSKYVGWAYKNPFGEVNLGIWADLSAPVNSSTFRAIGTLPEGYRPSAYETIETTIELRVRVRGWNRQHREQRKNPSCTRRRLQQQRPEHGARAGQFLRGIMG